MRKAAPLVICGIAMALTPSSASAVSTRAEYVAQVEPICQSAHVHEKHVARSYLRRIRRMVRHGLDPDHPTKAALRTVLRFTDHIARLARGAISEIALVAPAPGDEATVSEWLRLKTVAVNYFQRAYHSYARNQKSHQFRRLIGKSNDASLDSDSLVYDWGFHYCAPYNASS